MTFEHDAAVQHEGCQYLCHALIFSAVNREKVEPYTVLSRINVKKYLFLSIYIDIYMKRKYIDQKCTMSKALTVVNNGFRRK